MVFYEMLCIFADLERPALVEAIKRVSRHIIKEGGMIREFENLGRMETPQKMRCPDNTKYEGFANYLVIRYHGRPESNQLIAHNVKQEVMRRRIFGSEGFEFEVNEDNDEDDCKTAEDKPSEVPFDGKKDIKDFSKLRQTMELIHEGVWKRILTPALDEKVLTIGESNFEIVSLSYEAFLDGTDAPFDSTKNWKRQPAEVKVKCLLPGLRVGIMSMREGETALMLLAKEMFYGDMGCPPRIPQNSEGLYKVSIIEGFLKGLEGLEGEEASIEQILKEEGNRLFHKHDLRGAELRFISAEEVLSSVYQMDIQWKRMKQLLCLNRALIAIKLDEHRKAKDLCKEAIRTTWVSAKAFYRLGCAYIGLDEIEKAKKSFYSALEIDPTSAVIAEKLIELEKDRSDPKTIMMYKKMFGKVYPENDNLRLSKDTIRKLDEFIASDIQAISIDPYLFKMTIEEIQEQLKVYGELRHLDNFKTRYIENGLDCALQLLK